MHVVGDGETRMTRAPFVFLPLCAAVSIALAGCAVTNARDDASRGDTFYGTTEPFAAQAIYFVVTDRFVNGDPANDQREQGGAHRTFDVPVPGPNGESVNIGYLGG